jgi:glycosyltransferase involved in cell wall biosynthesis
MGKPVIASDHGGARETVLPDISGLLVRPGDAGALADAILRVTEMPQDTRSHMGMAGRGHIVQNFSRARMCADTIALYRSLLS